MFLTLRNKDWTGGDVTISDDGRFVVVQMRDLSPVQAYVVVDTITCKTVRGSWASLREAQLAAESMKEDKVKSSDNSI